MSNGARDRAAAPSNRRSRSSNAAPANLDPPPRLSIPEEPPKVPRRPPSKGNKRETLADIAKRIPVQLMRQYFNYPLRSAAEAMHISVTTLKRLCRRHGVKRWPHRQISGINRALNDLENQHQAAGEGDNGAVADQLRQLHRRREVIIELAFESDEEASRKGLTDAPPPAAHKRGHRATASSDSSSVASSSSALSTPSSSPRPRADSLAEAPGSPGSATSIGDSSKPTAAWWQPAAAAPGIDDSFLSSGPCKASSSAKARASNATKAKTAIGSVGAEVGGAAVGVDADAAVGVGAGSVGGGGGGVRAGAGVRRPRRSPGSAAGSTAASGSSRSGGSKTARTQRSSAMFGNIPRPGKARTTAHQRRKSGNDIAPVVTGAVRRYSVSAPSTSPSAFAGGVSSPGPSRMSVSGGVGGGGGMAIPGCHQLTASAAAGVAAAAAAAGRTVCGSNMFDQGVQVNQQMDDLAALGDLLFGPDETAAAAAAEAKGGGFLAIYPEIFSPSSSSSSSSSQQWSHGVPFCPPGVFSHDQSLLGAPSSFASHDHGFLTGMAFSNWGGLGSDRNGMGAPHSSVGPL